MSFVWYSSAWNILAVLITLCVGIATYFKWSYSYWKRKGLPFITPTSWYGTMENPFFKTRTFGFWLKQHYDEFKQKGLRHGGLYNLAVPVYFPVDPDCIKNVLQNDFIHFMDRGEYYNKEADPLSAHLFALEGQTWKNLRAKLTPVFTTGKMKMMFETLVDCSKPLKMMIDELTEAKGKVDIRDMAVRYTTDVIGSCAFGLECNSFKSPNAEFRQCGRELLQPSLLLSITQTICLAKPSIGHFFNIRAFPKSATDFLLKVVRDALLTEIKSNSSDDNPDNSSSLTMEEIAAQCLIFFVAGFETSSITLTFCLYELAKNQDIQQKVRDEINKITSKHDGEITYDSIMDMKYMTQVLDETLRKYPALPFLTRLCTKNYPLPNTNVVIEKGTSVFIPICGLHYDPDYYPDPEIFDPERFSEENKNGNRQFTYFPFGEGPRICIGLRFGMMQMKVALAVLLKNFRFSLNQNTPDIVTFNPKNFLLEPKETIWLDSKPINMK